MPNKKLTGEERLFKQFELFVLNIKENEGAGKSIEQISKILQTVLVAKKQDDLDQLFSLIKEYIKYKKSEETEISEMLSRFISTSH